MTPVFHLGGRHCSHQFSSLTLDGHKAGSVRTRAAWHVGAGNRQGVDEHGALRWPGWGTLRQRTLAVLLLGTRTLQRTSVSTGKRRFRSPVGHLGSQSPGPDQSFSPEWASET